MIITIFDDVKATSFKEFEATWEQICARVCDPKVFYKKSSMPLIKLAKFGDKKTDSNSYRHDSNVEEVYGIEGDYDGEQISIEEGASRLKKHGVKAILYTSPSHTADKPRWRVLAPFATAKEPEERYHWVGMINAALGGILARESFTLSQTFFFGSASTSYIAVNIDGGEFIDVKDGQWDPQFPATTALHTTGEAATPRSERISQCIAEIYSNTHYREPSLRLAAMLYTSGMTRNDAVSTVKSIMQAHPNPNGDLSQYIDMVDGYLTSIDEPKKKDKKEAEPQKIEVVGAAAFMNEYIALDYLLEGILEEGRLYSMTAPSGTGKTAVALMIAEKIALGKFLGQYETKQAGVLFMAGENPSDVRIRLMAMAERNTALRTAPISFIKGTFDIDKNIEAIKEQLAQRPDIKLVIVDTLQAFYQGDDSNSNTQMIAFAKALRQISESGLVVLVLAHPNKSADKERNEPYGGGAFVNEIDGNLALWKNDDDSIDFYWCKKFRGHFEPFKIELERVEASTALNRKGIPAETVVAKVVGDAREREMFIKNKESHTAVLRYLESNNSFSSFGEIARGLGWVSKKGLVERYRVSRIIDKLVSDKLVTKNQNGLFISKKGKEFLAYATPF